MQTLLSALILKFFYTSMILMLLIVWFSLQVESVICVVKIDTLFVKEKLIQLSHFNLISLMKLIPMQRQGGIIQERSLIASKEDCKRGMTVT